MRFAAAGQKQTSICKVGWGLAGLSVIEPCRQTFASEGKDVGGEFIRDDAYCLDGQKLVWDFRAADDQ